MKFWIKTLTLVVFSVFVINLTPNAVFAGETNNFAPIQKPAAKEFLTVSPLDLVNNPKNFMDKNIKMQAQFVKFTTLGLDYDRAMRDSKDYISVLIKRPDVAKQYTIPLSELKLIIKRDAAEKLIDMKSGDKIEITGKVFSSALNDPWVDVYKLTSLESKTANKNSGENAKNN